MIFADDYGITDGTLSMLLVLLLIAVAIFALRR